MNKRPRHLTKKIYTRISETDHERLRQAATDGGFRSLYELLKALVGNFLRLRERKRRAPPDEQPDEISALFRRLADAQTPHYVKPKRRRRLRSLNDE